MRDVEHPPLHPVGIRDIAEDQLYPVFVEPFGQGNAHEHRQNLLIRFGQFLNQFRQLELPAELWIDGSFATHAPDPTDVDVVFYMDAAQIDRLPDDRRALFERLFFNRKFMKAQYGVEVSYVASNGPPDYRQWTNDFCTCYDNVTPKGLFRLYVNL